MSQAIDVPTAPWAHYVFDLLAWLAALAAARWQHRLWPDDAGRLAKVTEPSYFLALAFGAVAGAWLLGSANSLRTIVAAPSHSVAGALAGGIAAVEIWKWRNGVGRSTGGPFVLPLSIGIAIGRLGCFFAGLTDFTYGTPTRLPWAVDLGDRIARHPVQLYESATMALFSIFYVWARRRDANWAQNHAFHAFILVYAAQRFVWEFLKPYPKLVGSLNLFHLLALGLFVYGSYWWARSRDGRRSST